ncbi:MAG: universal stress protein [Nitrosotalea sp.]
MSKKYTIKIQRTRNDCKDGTCGHPHEIPFTIKQEQIVCVDLSCKEIDTSLIKHIFVPYDGSIFSNRAFEFALDLAKKYGSSIIVTTVMTDSSFEDSSLDIQEVGKQIISKEKLASMEKLFKKIHLAAEKFAIPLKTEILTSSSVTDSLVSFASSNKADLIVMGTHGRGDYNRLLLGSVSIGVSHKASCPVLLIK